MVEQPAEGPSLEAPSWRLHGFEVRLVWRPAEARYVALVPALPRCQATGASRTEALRRLSERLTESARS